MNGGPPLSLKNLLKGPAGTPLLGVWFAVVLHFVWAGLLFFSPAPRHTTGIWSLTQLYPNRIGLAILLVVVAGSALAGLFHRASLTKIVLLVPQQIVLGISASGAMRSMVLGQYADGVQRDKAFLIADQMPVVLALVVHSITILFLAYLVVDRERQWDSK